MKYILFVCTHTAKAPWPEVVEVMREIGIDIASERPKKLDLEMQLHADWAITLGCGGSCPYVPTRVDDWDIPDPHGRSMEEVREIRDEIERRIVEFIDHRLEAVRRNRTAHELRLVRMLPDPDREFGGTYRGDEIRRCADAILAEYADVPVRSMGQTIAYRETRSCLREDRCHGLADLPTG